MEQNKEEQIKIEVDKTMRSAAEAIIAGDYQAAIVIIMEKDEDGDDCVHTFRSGSDPDTFYLAEYARNLYAPQPFNGCDCDDDCC